jgi:tetraacyldisaccharide 4'-kinase
MAPREPRLNRPRIERLWERKLSAGELAGWLPLAAAAGLYRLGVGARHLYWRRNKRRVDLTTISVGNLTVGGNGKTPFTLFLGNRLQSQGLRVAIVSRGYHRARTADRALLVSERGVLKVSPEQAGDEPTMLAKSFTGPIAVARHRIDAIELLSQLAPLDAVILDDGFQHERLHRDVDLLLVSDQHGFGNGWMLPAGPMREPIGSVRRADAVVVVNFGNQASVLSPREKTKLSSRTILGASIRPHSFLANDNGTWREIPLGLAGRRVLAVSGLADPSGFYTMLRDLDADLVGVFEYPDHHAYTSADWQTIVNAMRDVDLVITTEKDLVKLERFSFPRDSLYALRLEVAMEPADAQVLDDLILSHLNRRTATASHASQTKTN